MVGAERVSFELQELANQTGAIVQHVNFIQNLLRFIMWHVIMFCVVLTRFKLKTI